jgi:hypothetical protein
MLRLMLRPKVRVACGILWGLAWGAIAALLLLPLGAQAPAGSDLVAHFLVFAAMAFAAVGFSRRPGQLAVLALGTFAGGMALEFAQRLLPYRSFELSDLAADGLGAIAGYAAALLVLYFVIRPAEPSLQGAAS